MARRRTAVLLRAFPSASSLAQLCATFLETITFIRYPELVFLLGANEAMATLLEYTPAQVLLRWVNFMLPPGHAPISNLGDDLQDAKVYAAVLHNIFDAPLPPAAADADAVAAHVVHATGAAGIAVNVQPADLREGDELFNAMFIAHLFHAYRGGLRRREAVVVVVSDPAGVVESADEGPEDEAKVEVLSVPADVIPEPLLPAPAAASADPICAAVAATAAIPVDVADAAASDTHPEGDAEEEEEAVLKQWINAQRFGDLRIDDRHVHPTRSTPTVHRPMCKPIPGLI